mmetsp:Transcript_2159/g.5035  ORF Transcript_2159/g.5035 Transcript_2159/m.5035 type:complete len:519 (+) Transcript_2159:105-1661(+)
MGYRYCSGRTFRALSAVSLACSLLCDSASSFRIRKQEDARVGDAAATRQHKSATTSSGPGAEGVTLYRSSASLTSELQQLQEKYPGQVQLQNDPATNIDIVRIGAVVPNAGSAVAGGAGGGQATQLLRGREEADLAKMNLFSGATTSTNATVATPSPHPPASHPTSTSGAKTKLKAFFLFGEHARELVSPESGLHFLEEFAEKLQNNAAVSKSWEITAIVNANPGSHDRVVLNHEYCLRAAPSGVDLNRNFPDHWKKTGHNGTETWSGPTPLSEKEPALVASLLAQERPDLFVTVHSGTMSMFLPFCWTQAEKPRNYKDMLQILDTVNKNVGIPYGSAMETIHYKAAGNSMDFAYDEREVPYSFAFEIWGGPDATTKHAFREAYEEQRAEYVASGDIVSFLRKRMHLTAKLGMMDENNASTVPRQQMNLGLLQEQELLAAHEVELNNAQEEHSRALHSTTEDHGDYNADGLQQRMQCFHQFNPWTKGDYDTTMQKWTDIYLHLLQEVETKITRDQATV